MENEDYQLWRYLATDIEDFSRHILMAEGLSKHMAEKMLGDYTSAFDIEYILAAENMAELPNWYFYIRRPADNMYYIYIGDEDDDPAEINSPNHICFNTDDLAKFEGILKKNKYIEYNVLTVPFKAGIIASIERQILQELGLNSHESIRIIPEVATDLPGLEGYDLDEDIPVLVNNESETTL